MTVGLMTRGFSDAAKFVEKAKSDRRRQLNLANVFGMESTLREELATVWGDCRVPNWDGFQAMPVTQDSLRNAYQFLESLPLGFPAPSVGAEADGELTLEWHRGTRSTFSVSVGAEGELHYAGLFGPNRVYGTEAFFGEVPERILEFARRVYST